MVVVALQSFLPATVCDDTIVVPFLVVVVVVVVLTRFPTTGPRDLQEGHTR